MITRATIWLALGLFLAGEAGRARAARGEDGWSRCSWALFTTGALVCVVHMLAALHWHHEWSHASVVAETARQTEAVYGWRSGQGVYVNYVFVAAWLADAAWWRASGHGRRSAAILWTLRAFYFVVIVNAAVVFAHGFARVAGGVLVAALLAVWSLDLRDR